MRGEALRIMKIGKKQIGLMLGGGYMETPVECRRETHQQINSTTNTEIHSNS